MFYKHRGYVRRRGSVAATIVAETTLSLFTFPSYEEPRWQALSRSNHMGVEPISGAMDVRHV